MSTSARPTAKTWSTQHQIAVSDLRYGQCFNELCERFYARMDLTINLLQIVAGSTVVVSVFGAAQVGSPALVGPFGAVPPWLTALSGASVAIVSMLAILWQPGVKAERHKVAGAAFHNLLGKAWSLSTPQLLRELATAQRDQPLGLRSLEMPAYVRASKSIGVVQNEKLTWIERMFDAVA
jgi:hypothetical protein